MIYPSSKLSKKFTRRALLISFLQIGFASALGARMRYLQIEQADQYRLMADENRINVRLISPQRGEIFDRNGVILALNQQSFRITLVEEEAGDVRDVLEKLGRLIKLSEKDVQKTLSELERNAPFLPVTVVDRVSWDDVSIVAYNAPILPGITPETGLSRQYPLSEFFTHVVGYVGPVSRQDLKNRETSDPLLKIPRFQVGKLRLEASFENYLRGKAGISNIELNAAGRVMRELSRRESEAGSNLKLTVDAALQCYSQARLGEESASAVVIDCETGELLALTSSPSYDPNKFVRGISHAEYNLLLEDKRKPLVSKSVQGAYPPGSTFKMITALAGLEAGVIDENSNIYCPGHFEISGEKKYCWKEAGHGKVNLVRSLRESCNVFYYDLALKVGIKKIAEVARRFGLGEKHDINMRVENEGLIPSKEWKKRVRDTEWLIGDTASAAVGQGDVLASPLQLAVMTARMATGKMVIPNLVVANAPSKRSTDFIKVTSNPKHLDLIRKAMFDVSNARNGTGYKSRIIDDKFRMAGKTGTSQLFTISKTERKKGVTSNEDREWHRRDHALYVCFAPYKKPKVAVAVVVEHGGSGSRAAAPIARDILLQALHNGKPPLTAYPVKDRKSIKERQDALSEQLPNLTGSENFEI